MILMWHHNGKELDIPGLEDRKKKREKEREKKIEKTNENIKKKKTPSVLGCKCKTISPHRQRWNFFPDNVTSPPICMIRSGFSYQLVCRDLDGGWGIEGNELSPSADHHRERCSGAWHCEGHVLACSNAFLFDSQTLRLHGPNT